MFRIICLLIGYAVGLIQTSYIVGKSVAKIDIRQHGSGNAGTTNTLRVLGFKAGLVVFVCDVMKGVLAYTVCSLIFGGFGTFLGGGAFILPGIYGGIGCILGHCFPFYLNFKGGKGMASTLGVILCINLNVALIIFAAGIVAVGLSRYISVASLIIAALLPFGVFIGGFGFEAALVCLGLAALVWFLHRANISRLMNGTENKFTINKQVGK